MRALFRTSPGRVRIPWARKPSTCEKPCDVQTAPSATTAPRAAAPAPLGAKSRRCGGALRVPARLRFGRAQRAPGVCGRRTTRSRRGAIEASVGGGAKSRESRDGQRTRPDGRVHCSGNVIDVRGRIWGAHVRVSEVRHARTTEEVERVTGGDRSSPKFRCGKRERLRAKARAAQMAASEPARSSASAHDAPWNAMSCGNASSANHAARSRRPWARARPRRAPCRG